MALTPGGARGPTTPSPPPPEPHDNPAPQRGVRKPRWTRSTSISVLRLGLLIGGLVIITDLAAMAMSQRTVIPDDLAAIADADEILNYMLYALLGVLVVRDTRVLLSGVAAGLLASLLDALVVTVTRLMVPPSTPPDVLAFNFGWNLLIGTVFAGLSGVVYALVQRWSGGQRSRP